MQSPKTPELPPLGLASPSPTPLNGTPFFDFLCNTEDRPISVIGQGPRKEVNVSVNSDSFLQSIGILSLTSDCWASSPADQTFLSPLAHLRSDKGSISNPLHELEEVVCEPVTMADDKTIKKHNAVIQRVKTYIDDELSPLHLSAIPENFVQEHVDTANKYKGQLITAIEYLGDNWDDFDDTKQNEAKKVKKDLLDFIRRGMVQLKAFTNVPPPTSTTSMPKAKETLIRANVNTSLPKQVEIADAMVKDFQTLTFDDDVDDHKYRLMEDQYKCSVKRCSELIATLNSLAMDAVSVDMEDEGVRAQTAAINLADAKNDAYEVLTQIRRKLHIVGESCSNKPLDIKPPIFSGAMNDSVDYFSFKSKFEKYVRSKMLSKEDQLRILLDACLTGSALEGCATYTTLQDAWEYLQKTFGDPKILISHKLIKIRELGKCKGSPLERKEWYISLKDQLTSINRLALEHEQMSAIYKSDIVDVVCDMLPPHNNRDYRDRVYMKEVGTDEVVLFQELVTFVDELATRSTFDANFSMRKSLLASPEEKDVKKPTNSSRSQGQSTKARGSGRNFTAKPGAQAQVSQPCDGTGSCTGSGSAATASHKVKKAFSGNQKPKNSKYRPAHVSKKYIEPKPRGCVLCNGSHTHVYYCPVFLDTKVSDRFKKIGKLRSCFRCLRLDSEIDFSNREDWWEEHKYQCVTEFTCREGRCGKKTDMYQLHMTMCGFHAPENKEFEDDFLKSIDAHSLPSPNVKFFFSLAGAIYHQSTAPTQALTNTESGEFKVLPDIEGPAIFMVHQVSVDKDKSVLMFYDSGCYSATMSDYSYSLLETATVRPGPSYMEVAGNHVVEIEHGDEQFCLPLAEDKIKATITALRIPHITCKFPVWPLQEAFKELASAYMEEHPGSAELPQVPKEAGGDEVGIMLGSKYLKYFPEHIFSLPGGLGVYKTKFKTPDGFQGCLGGPWAGWKDTMEAMHGLSPRDYLTWEARVYHMQNLVIKHDISHASLSFDEKILELIDEDYDMVSNEESSLVGDKSEYCVYNHCTKHSTSEPWKIPSSWSIQGTSLQITDGLRRFESAENVGSWADYRCISCRNCAQCRKGESLERVSLVEEREQHQIEESVVFDAEAGKLLAYLPFVQDPTVHLQPNRHIALKILQSQLRSIHISDTKREEVLKSFEKLKSKGHIAKVSELSQQEKNLMNSTAGCAYYIPWRCVYKESSISTPLRLVYDGSSKTPQGNSLNNILAKGQNLLLNLLHILLRFRSHEFAFSADVSMAYNGIKLRAEHFIYQKFLWQENLTPGSEIVEMVIKTLIYGIRSSGSQTQAGFCKLSDYVLDHHPEYTLGARVLQNDTYVDDAMSSFESKDKCVQAAEGLKFTLSLAGMSTKDVVFSGQPPSDIVSTDLRTVGVVGYVWEPEGDFISLDIKDLYLGRPKRGKLPPKVEGDVGTALLPHFTRRTLVSKVAQIYDPIGLMTVFTAKLKLDLHDLLQYQLDWDDQVPIELLPLWVDNLSTIQELKTVWFRRCILPSNAASTDITLITSVDASKNIAAATVHARCQLKDGSYSCSLVAAKSKLVTTSTIPKAELKAMVVGAVLSHVCKKNYNSRVVSSIYVSDSTVSLYWLNTDQRPLMVGVRNNVIEIRRFTDVSQWYHIDGTLNIADLPTRPADIKDVGLKSQWQNGADWMSLPFDKMPIKTLEQISLTAEEKRLANTEIKSPSPHGITLTNLVTKVGDRYSFSKYIFDPCTYPWDRSVRSLGFAYKYIDKLLQRVRNKVTTAVVGCDDGWNLSEDYVKRAERYYFQKGTLEVKQFSKEGEYKHCSVMRDKILYYTGRLLEGQSILDPENIMSDLTPLSFVKPILDRYSPLAYSIMLYSHTSLVSHRNVISTLRESRSIAYILHGRELAVEIRKNCAFCKRYRAKLLQVELGKVHEVRITIAPAYWNCQVDLFGPMIAHCEHNHRALVKIWGCVFKCPATSAVMVHVMQKYSTDAFLQAFSRFGDRYGYPHKLYIDAGSQLVSACKNTELNWVDVSTALARKSKTGIDFETCPVGGHNAHGAVERSIKEIKKLFLTCFGGLKLDILSYETAFSFVSNDLNNMPLCIGSKYENLDHIDLITPNRLTLGRNNKRSPVGFPVFDSGSRLMKQMDSVVEAWWNTWMNEKLIDYIPQPPQWKTTSREPQRGDIVIFPREERDKALGQLPYRVGRVVEVIMSQDMACRAVVIQYKNESESKFRETRRSVRKIAIIHGEGELALVDQLNAASKIADTSYHLANRNIYP